MLPSRSRISAEAINTKILTKNHPDSLHSYPDFPDSKRSTPILCISTLILHIPTSISRVPVIPLAPFPDSAFRILQIATSKCGKKSKRQTH